MVYILQLVWLLDLFITEIWIHSLYTLFTGYFAAHIHSIWKQHERFIFIFRSCTAEMTSAIPPIKIYICRYFDRYGVLSELAGNSEIMIVTNTMNPRATVMQKDIFSPASDEMTKTKMFNTPRNRIGVTRFPT